MDLTMNLLIATDHIIGNLLLIWGILRLAFPKPVIEQEEKEPKPEPESNRKIKKELKNLERELRRLRA